MEITRIEKAGKKCRLYLNDAPAFCLYPSEIRKLGLREGDQLETEQLQDINRDLREKRAKKRCLLILKTADKTEKQLRDKLRGDEYPDEVIETAIAYVKSYGYVDDLRYAGSYIESMQESRSILRIRTDLMRKGISAQIVEEALAQCEAVDEQEQIRALLKKRGFCVREASPQERQKMIRFLMGKGYRYSQISKEIDIEG